MSSKREYGAGDSGRYQYTYSNGLPCRCRDCGGSDNGKPAARPKVTVATNTDIQLAQDFNALAKELIALALSKHADYGPDNINLAPGGALNGLRVRIHDKIARINHLLSKGADPQHESVEDSFKDLANYALIALLVSRGQWPQSK